MISPKISFYLNTL